MSNIQDYSIPEKKGGWLRKLLVIFIPILIFVAFVVAAIVVVKLNAEPEERKRNFNTLAVIADYARQDDVQLRVKTQGEVRPQIEIDLVPEVGGKIVYVSPNFIEGGLFRKGEVLVRIQDADFQVGVIRAEANVAQAQQVLVREKAEGEIARQDFIELGRTDEPSPLALREPQQAQARASLQAAQAELEAAKLNLSRTEVRAPFSGRVRTKSSDIGQFVAPGTRLASIFSTNIVEVRLPLSDDQLSKIDLPLAYVAKSRAEAVPVTLTARVAGAQRVWEGRIMRTDAAYDTQTRSLFAIAEVNDPYGDGVSKTGVPLAPGLFVDADIAGKKFENVIVIPRDGLRPQDEVYVVDDKGKAEIRSVVVLDATSERAVLTEGVSSGELVVLSPMERSRVEMTLKVLDANNPETVLVDPPKPDWQKSVEGKDGEMSDEKADRRSKKSETGSNQDDSETSENDVSSSNKSGD
ncbi:efflux RND transporter periplasmic adaptor subunit [Litorimonas sp. WD9-15]|uniref:efflux RND transporter periplasmic adaptor subunit n=1 Tax=Litorimonas sp. WD9-15 TaxID=3418716 RepID=UPI003CFD1302